MIEITPIKNYPKWFQIRWHISNFTVWIARKIYPENPAVTAFYVQQMHDIMITGNSFVRINPRDVYIEPKADV